MLRVVGRDRGAEIVRDTLIAAVARLPDASRGTPIWDQSPEVSEHRAFTAATDMEVYFCEPASPWPHRWFFTVSGLQSQGYSAGQTLLIRS